MSPLISRRAPLVLGLLLAAASAPGQTNTTLPSNPCVQPVPRTGKAYQRFRLLNQRVKENGGQAEVIFVGDSITERWESAGKAVWAHYYAPRHALNLGIGSDQTQHVLWRLERGNLDGLHPKLAVVLIGVNNVPHEEDTPRMVLEGVTAVVQKLREKLPQTKVLLLGIFPFRQDFCAQRAKALEVNQALAKLADGQSVFYLDIGSLFIEPDGTISKRIMPDYVHPSPEGYRMWAEAMEPTLARLLGEKPVEPAKD